MSNAIARWIRVDAKGEPGGNSYMSKGETCHVGKGKSRSKPVSEEMTEGEAIARWIRADGRQVQTRTPSGRQKVPGKPCGKSYISALHRCRKHYTNGKLNETGKKQLAQMADKVRAQKGLKSKSAVAKLVKKKSPKSSEFGQSALTSLQKALQENASLMGRYAAIKAESSSGIGRLLSSKELGKVLDGDFKSARKTFRKAVAKDFDEIAQQMGPDAAAKYIKRKSNIGDVLSLEEIRSLAS